MCHYVCSSLPKRWHFVTFPQGMGSVGVSWTLPSRLFFRDKSNVCLTLLHKELTSDWMSFNTVNHSFSARALLLFSYRQKKICEQIIGPPSFCVISCVLCCSSCGSVCIFFLLWLFMLSVAAFLIPALLGLSDSVYFLISLANQVVYKVLLFLFTEMNQLYSVSW